ncbi:MULTISPECIES: hypothetical protein [Nitrospirillum]|uniref:Uncharacterized protein n=2 Tax=Nitrospirillum TaxID=1543705 RepID=A0A248JLY3_9PROT|nr:MULTISPECIES: hypothetical protein [Nitrospirillum]ASG19480.1 hypothetical protein Y958_00565 [Nitrospirillum amazonense CBAmc]MDG3440428.1 hypothetical protein [Nitrospirillum amazonense]MEA1649560.1 hypothetical protein [Nitrospirillum sp. BR 11164]TWB22566.1 hypothetical protein FBZ89_103189 [Nitrospirillum amazonense]TWB42003.1 hypothetical protein FBZ91_10315 [Nitrospirillum amazonense]
MTDTRRTTAIAIKHCLDNLALDARRNNMGELVHLLGLASLAAEDAAKAADSRTVGLQSLLDRTPQGRC